ncbi:manganese catalase family protein [Clostridiaceae bacterium Marseille-Q4145]|nr:manganese catalase family protein [Clostridiaceae bacterium Marseille-Q4145]
MPDCLADIPLGGPDGELSASMRYLAQRYTMPYRECMATLTDIGTEESVPARWK